MTDSRSLRPSLTNALTLHNDGRGDEAERAYRQILRREPRNPDAWHLLGVLLSERGDHDAGIASIRTALSIREALEYHLNLASSLLDAGRKDEALDALMAALRVGPDRADIHFRLGNLFHQQRRPNEAVAAYRQAIALQPGFVEALNNLGSLFLDVGQTDAAIAAFTNAIQAAPANAESHGNLGYALDLQDRLGEAAAAYRVALNFQPDFALGWSNLGNVLKGQGHLDQAMAAYRSALTHRPDYPMAHSNVLMAQHYLPECGNADFLAAAREWAGPADGGHAVVAPVVRDDGPRPLRVGYVSSDFNSHPVGYFLESVLRAHDRKAVTAFGYANNVRTDDVTESLRAAADGWRPIVGLDDAAVADRIRRDGIDILVDLSGHTGNNRLTLFARRPAPVQASWLGYFGTTGLPAMDWVIADRHVLPPGEERFFTEKVWRLPDSYLCFTPPAEDVPVGPLPMLGGGPVTLGAFHNRAKITRPTVALWARVLTALPQARLLLKSREFADYGVRQALRDQFAAHGIAPNRLRMEGKTPRADYFRSHNGIDLALSPTPFGGGTTTAESLWMGVPVVTLRGDRWAGRIGVSFLETLGLADRLVADSPENYVAKTAALVGDPDSLAALRAGLRERVRQSPLCDAPAFARSLEEAYRSMWREP
ncbi:putative O-linked N-acetylglucosamine transferase (SPINDLY family) [Azospirillum brasilense]|uniref:protein O-GlcNAc transferase n=1 Tax=Azospirillum brasilense TaxID=192 RepID=A0A560BPN4_AZOBR|nr:tetratricopeptide repeat protein [Azospirillum brasilense]TWA74577.1 putative O-linked N-acetylglucosamine transferase (SPINDLY family) [Azospirillum brasilense]